MNNIRILKKQQETHQKAIYYYNHQRPLNQYATCVDYG